MCLHQSHLQLSRRHCQPSPLCAQVLPFRCVWQRLNPTHGQSYPRQQVAVTHSLPSLVQQIGLHVLQGFGRYQRRVRALPLQRQSRQPSPQQHPLLRRQRQSQRKLLQHHARAASEAAKTTAASRCPKQIYFHHSPQQIYPELGPEAGLRPEPELEPAASAQQASRTSQRQSSHVHRCEARLSGAATGFQMLLALLRIVETPTTLPMVPMVPMRMSQTQPTQSLTAHEQPVVILHQAQRTRGSKP